MIGTTWNIESFDLLENWRIIPFYLFPWYRSSPKQSWVNWFANEKINKFKLKAFKNFEFTNHSVMIWMNDCCASHRNKSVFKIVLCIESFSIVSASTNPPVTWKAQLSIQFNEFYQLNDPYRSIQQICPVNRLIEIICLLRKSSDFGLTTLNWIFFALDTKIGNATQLKVTRNQQHTSNRPFCCKLLKLYLQAMLQVKDNNQCDFFGCQLKRAVQGTRIGCKDLSKNRSQIRVHLCRLVVVGATSYAHTLILLSWQKLKWMTSENCTDIFKQNTFESIRASTAFPNASQCRRGKAGNEIVLDSFHRSKYQKGTNDEFNAVTTGVANSQPTFDQDQCDWTVSLIISNRFAFIDFSIKYEFEKL